jgi:hypothetical protein
MVLNKAPTASKFLVPSQNRVYMSQGREGLQRAARSTGGAVWLRRAQQTRRRISLPPSASEWNLSGYPLLVLPVQPSGAEHDHACGEHLGGCFGTVSGGYCR